MLASYTFNTQYQPNQTPNSGLPNLRLLEGGKFHPDEFSPILIHEDDRISLRFFKWGMNPNWPSKIPATRSQRTAPADYLFRHPNFNKSILSRRCLVPADGFYHEQDLGNQQRNYKIAQRNRETFCFAGIYDSWVHRDGSIQHAFSIITTPSNEKMGRFGLQMPLILSRQDERIWINPKANLNKISQILYAPSKTELAIHPVVELREASRFSLPDQVAA